MYNILCRGKKRTSPSLGSSSESASPAPVSSPPALATFGVKDGDDLGDRLTADGCWGLEKASHRHTIICVQTNQCTEYFEISKNINQMVCLREEQTLHTSKWLAVTKVWSKKLRAGYRAPSLQPMSYLCELYFSLSSVVSCTLSVHSHVVHIFDVQASSSPLGYPCANFFLSRPPLLS